MTTTTIGARVLLLVASGLAFAGVAAFASAQEQPPQGELLRAGPMLLGGAAGLGAAGQGTEPDGDGTEAADGGGMAGHDGAAVVPERPPTGPADAAYQAAMTRMHLDMTIESTGDPDVDFARAMIPHHQGAVEMAKVVLAHGKDAEIRKLAETVISTQEREIAQLNEWLARQPQQ